MIVVLSTLINKGYDPAYVAGVLGNIQAEGTVGHFESSAYKDESKKPLYLKYMEKHYNYSQDFSGKNISEVGVEKTYNLLQRIIADNVHNIAGFALGSCQWTLECSR